MLEPEGDELRLFSEATDLLFGASRPNVPTLWNTPDAEAAEVPEVLSWASSAAVAGLWVFRDCVRS